MTDLSPHPLAELVASLVAETSPYMSCDDCFQRLVAYIEALALDPLHEDVAMAVHLRGCAACADEAQALLELIARPSTA